MLLIYLLPVFYRKFVDFSHMVAICANVYINIQLRIHKIIVS